MLSGMNLSSFYCELPSRISLILNDQNGANHLYGSPSTLYGFLSGALSQIERYAFWSKCGILRRKYAIDNFNIV
jgi:hypothetical protein